MYSLLLLETFYLFIRVCYSSPVS